MTLTGDSSGSTSSDSSGNYSFNGLASASSYTVTPSKAALPSGSAGIRTVDVLAVQRHYLGITPIPTGCRLLAADANADNAISTADVVAIQRFSLGLTTGLGNVGTYQFIPLSRSYSGVSTNQPSQNYDVLIIGDVASPFVH